ncbi:MAG: histidine phosphatase family protein [Rhodobacteraceae bacterium]|nr:histidine phosphatase family protein [Paracoccaceae bacterium]
MSSINNVIWIRHAITHTRTLVGWTDIEADLSDVVTLSRLRNRLPEDAIVVSSDLKRASQTADAIVGRRRRLPDDRGLREIHFGLWEGKTTKEIEMSHPVISRRFWTNPRGVSPPQGESWQDVGFRASDSIDRLIQQFPGDTIVAVAHFGTILSQACRANNADQETLFATSIANLSMTILRHDGDHRELLEFSKMP